MLKIDTFKPNRIFALQRRGRLKRPRRWALSSALFKKVFMNYYPTLVIKSAIRFE